MLDFASWPLKKPTIENISAISAPTVPSYGIPRVATTKET